MEIYVAIPKMSTKNPFIYCLPADQAKIVAMVQASSPLVEAEATLCNAYVVYSIRLNHHIYETADAKIPAIHSISLSYSEMGSFVHFCFFNDK